MKPCFKCLQEKELSEFYKHPRMKDGRLNKCKECNKIDVIKNRKENISHYRDFDKKRSMIPHRVAARKEYMKTSAGKLSHRKSNQKYKNTYLTAAKAKSIFGYALKSGDVIRPNKCSKCPSTKLIQGHHDDYSKPLEVRWLCCRCHNLWHKANTPLNRI